MGIDGGQREGREGRGGRREGGKGRGGRREEGSENTGSEYTECMECLKPSSFVTLSSLLLSPVQWW